MSRIFSLFLVVLALVVGGSAFAAPFLISDPWAAGGPQPDKCTATELPGPTTRDLALNVGETGQKSIRADMANAANGTHTWTIVCTSNDPMVSASSPVDFTFAVGALASPSGLRLVP